jgi:hypothetical protein
MPRPVHFEIPADDPARAEKFYSDLFGWKFTKWDGPNEYWLVQTGDGQPGIDGGMLKRPEPNYPMVNTIDVSSVDEFTARATASGGKVIMPKMAIPGIGWLAYCADPEGNVFGMMEADEKAA